MTKKDELRNFFIVNILTKTGIMKKEILTTEENVEFFIGNQKVSVSSQECWTMPSQLLDRYLKKIKSRFMVLVKEPTYNEKLKKLNEPVIISKAVNAENSSSILWRVKKYRGVKQGIEDQFRQPSTFSFPSWALVLVIIVLIIGGVIMLSQLGYLGGIV